MFRIMEWEQYAFEYSVNTKDMTERRYRKHNFSPTAVNTISNSYTSEKQEQLSGSRKPLVST